MEPDVIRMYSSSPPPLEDGEEEDDFGDFGGFSGVPNSVSFTEFDTPTSFNQVQALNATSPPELLNNGRMVGLPSLSGNVGASIPQEGELSKANGVLPGGCHTSSPSERTVGEAKKALSCLPDVPRSGHTEGQLPVDCNGEGSEVLTNGFAICEDQGSPPLQNCIHSCRKGASTADTDTALPGSQEDEFADFAAFSDADTHLGQTEHMTEDLHIPEGGSSPPPQVSCQLHCNIEQGIQSEANNGEADRIGLDEAGSGSISFSTELTEELSDWHQGSYSDSDSKQPTFVYIEAVCTATEALALNGFDCDSSDEMAGSSESDPSREKMSTDEEGSQSQGKASGNGTETETETETSFGRPLSTDALEEYGDVSTTGSVPSPPLQEDTATPADHSQLPEDDEDFGDFDSGGCFGAQGFADFDQLDVQPNPSSTFTPGLEPKGGPRQDDGDAEQGDDDGDADDDDGDDFGDFNTPRFQQAGTEGEDKYNSNDDEDRGQVAGFTTSNSFGNFNSVAVGVEPGADAGWSAFSEEPLPAEGDSWAAFSKKEASACPSGPEEWHEATPEAVPSASSDQSGRTDNRSVVLSSRLERLFQHSFPENPVPELGEEVLPLKSLLEPTGEEKGSLRGPEDGQRRSPLNGALRADVWRQLQDIHEAFGLRHQWGGSHSNKTLLCSLGIDTRNILFTGQKKQPIIVPMYAASLGMLEPTKEPVKPVSAAEMIASIAQAPPVGPEKSPCPPDTAQQEALPPVQFDWSSSGLTNPLDASGGSSLLNLDFFGPVEDSGSTSSTSIPGVDPELYELTTAKLDSAGSGSRVVDAFARLMSTMEKTSTSARKPKKEENLSQEAAKVIASLPDLSFMQAKVLMFPATLTPLGCSGATSD